MLRTLESQPDFEKPVVTGREVRIAARGGKRARGAWTALTELTVGRVELQPPKERPRDGPVGAWADTDGQPEPLSVRFATPCRGRELPQGLDRKNRPSNGRSPAPRRSASQPACRAPTER